MYVRATHFLITKAAWFYSTQVYPRQLNATRYCLKICRTWPSKLLLYCVYCHSIWCQLHL